MQLNLDGEGLAHLTLDPDEHLVVQIGGAELTLIGGWADTPGARALVQILLPGDLDDTPDASPLDETRAPHAHREPFVLLARPAPGGRCGVHPARRGGRKP